MYYLDIVLAYSIAKRFPIRWQIIYSLTKHRYMHTQIHTNRSTHTHTTEREGGISFKGIAMLSNS